MSESGYVYTLVDPRNGEPRYVGATNNPDRRFREHMSRSPNDDVSEWIESLESEGHEPDMQIISVEDLSEVAERELELISEFGEEHDLLNAHENQAYDSSANRGKKYLTVNTTNEQYQYILATKEESVSQRVRELVEKGMEVEQDA